MGWYQGWFPCFMHMIGCSYDIVICSFWSDIGGGHHWSDAMSSCITWHKPEWHLWTWTHSDNLSMPQSHTTCMNNSDLCIWLRGYFLQNKEAFRIRLSGGKLRISSVVKTQLIICLIHIVPHLCTCAAWIMPYWSIIVTHPNSSYWIVNSSKQESLYRWMILKNNFLISFAHISKTSFSHSRHF